MPGQRLQTNLEDSGSFASLPVLARFEKRGGTTVIAKKRTLALLAVGLALTGCAATVTKSPNEAPVRVASESAKSIVLNVTGSKVATESKDWEQLKGEWRAAMKSEADRVGASSVLQEGDPKPTGEPSTLVVVDIADYRYISPGARYGFGIMTGNAFIKAKVQFRDLVTGDMLGERSYDTSSTAWQGVFSAMTEKQVQAICKQIVDEVAHR